MRLLERLYLAAGYAAAAFLAAIAAVILAQIGGRLFGYRVPDGDDLAGWCMAASSFLALAHTLRAGGHIRVSLVTDRLPPSWQRAAEVWAHLAGGGVSLFFAIHAARHVHDSFTFGDRSYGVLAVPLWIPQLAMAVGAALLALALAEGLVALLRGAPPAVAGEPARTE